MSLVLVVDDVAIVRDQYAYDIGRLGGLDTVTAASGAEALAVLDHEPVDCVILDLEMPGLDGFDVLARVADRAAKPGSLGAVPVIVYTGTGDYARCVRAVKLGAYSFIDKGEPIERVVQEIANALEARRLAAEVTRLRRDVGDHAALVGASRAMQEMRALVGRLAPIPSPVLITGESGTGKELVARALHELSGRGRRPFVAVNCAALPESLVESELFGRERGAFTGADRTQAGAFESATSGTLLLDEIGELAATAQAKLLRVLEEETVMRVGGARPIRIDTRVIAATNRDLDQEVAARRFREDLLFRLNVHVVRVPPLRERLSDLPDLIAHFLALTCSRFGMRPKEIAPAAIELLAAHDWRRNNVRELRNVVERLVIACEGQVIGAEDVPAEVRGGATRAGTGAQAGSGTLRERKQAAEREIVLAALERHGWQITRTAAALGLADHASLLKVMKRHGLKRK